jgi:hypothetical protein
VCSATIRVGRSGDRIPDGGRFSVPVLTGYGYHPGSVSRGYSGLCSHPLLFSVEVREIVELYLYSPFGPSWRVQGRTSPLTFIQSAECGIPVLATQQDCSRASNQELLLRQCAENIPASWRKCITAIGHVC